MPCAYGDSRFWPPENCGFSHDERENAAEEPNLEEQKDSTKRIAENAFQQAPQELRRKVEELLRQRDWDVQLSYVCRRESCSASFTALDELFEHQSSGAACP